MPIISDGKGGVPGEFPYEPSAETAAQGYQTSISPGLGGYVSGFNRADNPVAGFLMPRLAESQFREKDWFRDAMNQSLDPYGNLYGAKEPFAYQPSPKITPQEAHDKYGKELPEGTKPIFSEPVEDKLAETVYQHKKELIQAQSDMARFEANNGVVTNFAASMAASLIDPINLGTTFVPVLGEEAILARMGISGFGARLAARAISGGVTVPVQQAGVSALKYGLSPEGADYGFSQALNDVAMSVPMGVLGTLLLGSAIHEPLNFLRDRQTTSTINGVSQRAQAVAVANADAPTNEAAIRSAVSQMATGRTVDVADLFPNFPKLGDTAVARAMDNPALDKFKPVELTLDQREVARQLDPKLMKNYESLEAQRSQLSSELDRLNQARTGGEGDLKAAQGVQDQINELQRQLAGRLGKARRASIEDQVTGLQDQLKAMPAGDDFMKAQKSLQDIDNQMRDMAPQFSAVMARSGENIARANVESIANQFDAYLNRVNSYFKPEITDYTGMLGRNKKYWETGKAPGMTPEEIARAIAETKATVNAPEPPAPPTTPPEGFLKAKTATEPPQGAATEAKGSTGSEGTAKADPYQQAVKMALANGSVASSEIQKELGVGYNEASKLRDRLIKDGVIDANGKAYPGEPLVKAEPMTFEQAYPGIDATKLSEADRNMMMSIQREFEAGQDRQELLKDMGRCMTGE